ncbi:MAG: molybdopterin oxidoreductase, partial [Rhodospirillales bacterium]|nr:molybdopterin oxidoreductase [Acetobacter sp.]
LALGGLAGCDKRQPSSGTASLVPYVNQPTALTPSVPLQYASAALLDGIANGVLVTTVNGRPIKIEGNPQHPFSRGGTDIVAQASVLGLYDPDRSQSVQHLSAPSSWDVFQGEMVKRLAPVQAAKGAGLHLLTGPTSSPTLLDRIARLKQALPDMHWYTLNPVGRDAIYAGAQMAFGQKLETLWHFDKASVIVSLDGDFLDSGPHQIAASRAWVQARRDRTGQGALLTMHAVAPTPTLTWAKADHHAPVAQRDMMTLAQAILADIRGNAPAEGGPSPEWRARAVAKLKEARGAGIVLTGLAQPPELHALVHQINAELGNIGPTISYVDPVLGNPEPFTDLVTAMQSGSVSTLVMFEANPVYTAPAETGFAAMLGKVPLKLHAGLHVDETALHADWHLPMSHPLESWLDARSLDGTATLLQPTIQSLYDTRTPTEILSLLFDQQPQSAYDMLRGYWQAQNKDSDFNAFWQRTLEAGFVANSAFPLQTPAPNGIVGSSLTPDTASSGATSPEILIRPDPTIRDGAMANNAWLQELPKPLLKTVWENVVLVSPAYARQQKLEAGDIVVVEANGQSVFGPVWPNPGQNDDTIVLHLGYGRPHAGSVADNIGYDAYPLRRMQTPWHVPSARFHRGEGHHAIPDTQQLDTQEGKDYIRLQEIGAKPVGDDDAY